MTQAESAPVPSAEEVLEECGAWIARMAARLTQRMPWADYDDLLQQGMLRALEARDNFNPRHGTSFLAYIRPRVHGAMIDMLRHQGSLRRRDDRAAQEAGQAEPAEALDALLSEENLETLSEEIAYLPTMERTVISLFYLDELSNREIAAILDLSEARATRLRQKAIALLAKRVEMRSKESEI